MNANDDVIDPAALSPEQQPAADEIGFPVTSLTLEQEAGAKAVSPAVPPAPLVEGSLWKAIWIMSWPLMVMTISASLVGLVDVQVAKYLGASAQAAVGIAEQIIFVFMICIMSLGVGTTAIVSRAYGEGNREEANRATAQSLTMSVLTGLILTATALFTAHYLFPLFSQSKEVVALGDVYLGLFSLYIVPFSVVCITNASFRAIGDARTPLLIVLSEAVVNVAGDYLTVVGNWPVPGLGVRGIAASAIVGATVGSVVAILCIYRSPLRSSLRHILPVSTSLMRRILHIGVPAALQRTTWAVSVFVVFTILARLPESTPALASWTIGMRVEGLLFMPLMALSLAVGSIVGQNLGAKQVERAFKAGWHVTNIGVGLMIVLAVVLYVMADPIAQFMSQDPKTIEFSASYLRINALAEPLLAVNMILSGALQGAGDTRITMWVSVITNWLIRLPVAWFLALTLNWGPAGVWAAMSGSVGVAALIIAARFQSRAWTKIKV